MSKAILKYLAITVVILAVIAGVYNNEKYKKEQIAHDIEVNRRAIKSLEQRDLNEIEKLLKNIRKEYGINLKDSNNISNKRYFEDSVFMGDSLMEPLSLYDFLPPVNVVARMGRNTSTAHEDLKDLKKVAPVRIFMMYGMNDLTIWGDEGEFKESYLNLINKVREIQPNSEIVLLSILPVTDAASKRQPVLSKDRISEYNEVIKEIAEENSLIFLDVTSLITSNDIYEPDGVHVKAVFYGRFLDYIKAEFISRL